MTDLFLTPHPTRNPTARTLPLEQDPRQGSLFSLLRAMPSRKLAPQVPQTSSLTPLDKGRLDDPGQEAIPLAPPVSSPNVGQRSASDLCPECGDSLPPRVKVCPNCYTTIKRR